MTNTFLTALPGNHTSLISSGEMLAGLEYHACHFAVESYHDRDYQSLDIQAPNGFERYVAKRKAEYLAGRYCAKMVLARLGYSQKQVPIGRDRAPVWPESIVGSITHSHGYAGCVALRKTDSQLRGVGIDAEKIMSDNRAECLYGHIVNEQEKRYLHSPNCPWHTALSIVFSAKESLFKMLYPAVQQYFDFLDAEVVHLNLSSQQLTLRLLRDLGSQANRGSRYLAQFEIVKDSVQTLAYY